MIQRIAKQELVKRLGKSPAVSLIGPRQCGKTTLAQSLGGRYFDLEQETERLRLNLEWDRLVSGNELLVMDEAQSSPDVFVRLRGAIDADRKRNGRFLLLGSVSPALMTHVSESLAGRLSILELTPFLLPEVASESEDRLWLCGGYPDGGILDPPAFPQWQGDYLALLTQRDLPLWGLPAKPQTTQRFLRMVAAVHGQTWNASQVGQSMGLDHKTVNSYLDYLVGACLVRRMAPYQSNIKKRLVKSPKIYLRDSGLLHSLLNTGDMDALLSQPWVGASWEGFVVEQIVDVLNAKGRRYDAYHFRTNDQHEVDLVLDFGREIWAVEIKLTTSPGPRDFARLTLAADLIGAQRRFLVSRVAAQSGEGNTISCNLVQMLEHLSAG